MKTFDELVRENARLVALLNENGINPEPAVVEAEPALDVPGADPDVEDDDDQ